MRSEYMIPERLARETERRIRIYAKMAREFDEMRVGTRPVEGSLDERKRRVKRTRDFIARGLREHPDVMIEMLVEDTPASKIDEHSKALALELVAYTFERWQLADASKIAELYSEAGRRFRARYLEHAVESFERAHMAVESPGYRLDLLDAQHRKKTGRLSRPYIYHWLWNESSRYGEAAGLTRLLRLATIIFVLFSLVYLPRLPWPDSFPSLEFGGSNDPSDSWVDSFAISLFSLLSPLKGDIDAENGWATAMVSIESAMGYLLVLLLGSFLVRAIFRR